MGDDKNDMYLLHRADLKTPIEKTVQAMAELKKWVDTSYQTHPRVKMLIWFILKRRQNRLPRPERSLGRRCAAGAQNPSNLSGSDGIFTFRT